MWPLLSCHTLREHLEHLEGEVLFLHSKKLLQSLNLQAARVCRADNLERKGTFTYCAETKEQRSDRGSRGGAETQGSK